MNASGSESYLAQDDEHSVDELVELRQVEDIHPEPEGALVDVLAAGVAEEVLEALGGAVQLKESQVERGGKRREGVRNGAGSVGAKDAACGAQFVFFSFCFRGGGVVRRLLLDLPPAFE